MAEISYSTLVLSLGSDTQFLHNISSFLYTTSSGQGLRCSLSSISVLLLLQAKGIDEFRPEGARAAGGLGDFPPLAKQRELERVGLNEFPLLCQFVLRGGLVSFLLDFWQLTGYGRHFFRAEKNVPVRGAFSG